MRWHALEVWQFINIFLLSLVTGVFWETWLGLSRSALPQNSEISLGHSQYRER